MLRDALTQAMKDAMKAGDKRRLSTLRLVLAAIKDRDIAARVDADGNATGIEKVADGDILSLLQKMIKQRRESVATYQQAGRADLVEQESQEIAIIEEYLPKQMDADQMRGVITTVIGELGAAGLKDMGRVMAALKERYVGQMDFGKASGLVKELLG